MYVSPDLIIRQNVLAKYSVDYTKGLDPRTIGGGACPVELAHQIAAKANLRNFPAWAPARDDRSFLVTLLSTAQCIAAGRILEWKGVIRVGGFVRADREDLHTCTVYGIPRSAPCALFSTIIAAHLVKEPC
jgi:hypothetical protein